MVLEKKAQVNIISIILIILISLVAVIIFWNVFNPLINQKSEGMGIDSLTINLNVKEVVVTEIGASKVLVSRNVGKGKIDSLIFVFYDENGNSKTKEIDGSMGELDTKTYSFIPMNLGKISSVSVFPVFNKKIGREFQSKSESVLELPKGLVSWWRFDNAEDFVGNNPGNLVGAEINGKLVLNGNNYFSVNDDNSLDLNKELTLSLWLNNLGENGELIKKGENYEISLENEKVKFSYSGGNFVESYDVLEQGWNHILISLGEDGFFKMFVNGAAASDFKNLNVNLNINDDSLIIGQGVSGEIDNVMVFNRSLSWIEIQPLYNLQLNEL